MQPKKLCDEICKILSSKKAKDILRINVAKKTTLADYFVVAGGNSATHVTSLCDYLEDTLEKQDIKVLRKEGVKEGRWGVLDYGDVIVHVFNDETRLFFQLEQVWEGKGNVSKFED